MQCHSVDPVEEVFPKLLTGSHGRKIAVGRGNKSNVHFPGLNRAEGLDLRKSSYRPTLASRVVRLRV